MSSGSGATQDQPMTFVTNAPTAQDFKLQGFVFDIAPLGDLDLSWEPPSAEANTHAVLARSAAMRELPPAEFVLQELPDGGTMIVSQSLV